MVLWKKEQSFDTKLWPSFEKLYLDYESADIIFEFKRSVIQVPAHKYILSSQSDMFNSMFNGNFLVGKYITIDDANDVEFIEFLQYFYLKEATLTGENVAEVFYLARKYLMENIEQDCVKLMYEALDTENVCQTLDLALFFDSDEL